MFALLAAGRLVQTNFVQNTADPSKFVTVLEAANTVNHVAFFLTGTAPLPPGFGASLYLGYPIVAAAPMESSSAAAAVPSWNPPQTMFEWKWMGFVTNEKPSAIFRLGGQRVAPGEALFNCQVGVSIEPLQVIQNLAASGAAANPHIKFTLEEMGEFCRRMLGSFLNYAGSFIVQVPVNPQPLFGAPNSQAMIPADVLQKWYATVERKSSLDPAWWKSI